MNKNNRVIQTLMTMAVLYDKPMNEAAAEMLLSDLSELREDSILEALKKCRQELSKFPTISEIVSRAQKRDGRLGAEEAWSMIPRDEANSVVWTKEMRTAHNVASKLMSEDMVAARMAFKESYDAAVKDSRSQNIPVEWVLSSGYDKSGREPALREAIDKKRISIEHAKKLMPEFEPKKLQVLIGENHKKEIQKLIEETF